jgi:tetratricopeptide (TPR) repeat protein
MRTKYLKQLANAYTDSGYVEEAMEICLRLLSLEDNEIFLNLGRCCKILKRYDEALSWYEKVLSTDPHSIEVSKCMSSSNRQTWIVMMMLES